MEWWQHERKQQDHGNLAVPRLRSEIANVAINHQYKLSDITLNYEATATLSGSRNEPHISGTPTSNLSPIPRADNHFPFFSSRHDDPVAPQAITCRNSAAEERANGCPCLRSYSVPHSGATVTCFPVAEFGTMHRNFIGLSPVLRN